jgi:hypothetical protein
MNPQIQSNQRLTYLNTLASARELHQFIQYLDQKYGVDSTDPDNTFGRIFLNRPIVQYGVANTLYLARIDTYKPDNVDLPKHRAIPHANSVVGINKTGNVGIAKSQEHIKAQRVPITVEKSDIEKLVQLRNNFKAEVKANAPLEPVFSNELLEKYNTFKDTDDKPISFYDLSQALKNRIYDKILADSGFATGAKHSFHVTMCVPNFEGEFKKFNVDFYRLHTNAAPHFATSYQDWQKQDEMDKNHPAYTFYKKWDVFHTYNMTIEEWLEMKGDLDELYELSKNLAPNDIARKFTYCAVRPPLQERRGMSEANHSLSKCGDIRR